MAETCIVCLGDLRNGKEDDSPQVLDHPSPTPSSDHSKTSWSTSSHDLTRALQDLGRSCLHTQAQSPDVTAIDQDEETVAHLLPCKHDLHNSCLKPWVERANSCPICRATFNEVELKQYIGGPTLSTYAVQDKRQEADLDPTLVVDDDVFEEDEPCMICTTINNSYEVMYCDGCDRAVHVFCAGCQDAPDVWYCTECIQMLDNDGNLPLSQSTTRRSRRQRRDATERPNRRRRTTRRPNSDWARVWQTVWNNLNLDLDFPFDDEPIEARRTPAQRREFNAWQRRLRVANQHGAGNRFRETATALLERPPSDPESQEELRAWNAFDKARELQGEAPVSDRRKRKATTESPASPKEPENAPRRPLKRPRTRRMLPPSEVPSHAESSLQAAARPEAPSFLTSLLNEVERQQPISDQASPVSMVADDQTSAGPMSSPEGSPVLTGHNSPRIASATPPPLTLPRPSYTPLTSVVRPSLSSPISAYSPFSPAETGTLEKARQHPDRGRTHSRPTITQRNSSPHSPSSNLSYSTKAEIQRMVKSVLKPAYQNNEVDKDQYTDINMNVSRSLYDQVENAGDLADHDSRNRLQTLADELVRKAIDDLKA